MLFLQIEERQGTWRLPHDAGQLQIWKESDSTCSSRGSWDRQQDPGQRWNGGNPPAAGTLAALLEPLKPATTPRRLQQLQDMLHREEGHVPGALLLCQGLKHGMSCSHNCTGCRWCLCCLLAWDRMLLVDGDQQAHGCIQIHLHI